MLCQFPAGHVHDGLAVAADGRLFVTTVTSHGVSVVSPDGELRPGTPFWASRPVTGVVLDVPITRQHSHVRLHSEASKTLVVTNAVWL